MKIFIILIFYTFNLSSGCFAQDIVLIVNKSNPNASLRSEQLRDFYMKKVRSWPDGTSVRFIDRRSGSTERMAFLKLFLKKQANDIDLYWIGQKLYTGAIAPLQVSSDDMAISLVSSFPGAISYVTATSVRTDKVKVISIAD